MDRTEPDRLRHEIHLLEEQIERAQIQARELRRELIGFYERHLGGDDDEAPAR